MIGLAIYFLTPLYWLAIASTKDNTDLFSSFGLWFAHFNLWQNLSDTFTHADGEYPRWLLNTVIYAVVGGFFSMVVSIMAGYALAKFRFVGRNLDLRAGARRGAGAADDAGAAALPGAQQDQPDQHLLGGAAAVAAQPHRRLPGAASTSPPPCPTS